MADQQFEPEFASASQAARLTGLSKPTLCRLRMHKSPDSPPWFRVGSRVLYPVAGIREWANARLTTTMGAAR
jgi:predicted DNA-binding transcriptional regulator AlpA